VDSSTLVGGPTLNKDGPPLTRVNDHERSKKGGQRFRMLDLIRNVGSQIRMEHLTEEKIRKELKQK
jgi:hypothetical protein